MLPFIAFLVYKCITSFSCSTPTQLLLVRIFAGCPQACRQTWQLVLNTDWVHRKRLQSPLRGNGRFSSVFPCATKYYQLDRYYLANNLYVL